MDCLHCAPESPVLTGGLRLQFRATEKHFAGAGWEKKKIPLRLQPSQKASLELWVCGPAPTLHCLGQSQAGGSSRPGAQAEHCPRWGSSIAPSRTEVAWAPALPGKGTTGLGAGAGRWRKRTCRACERSSGSWGEVLFSLPHVSFVFRSPTEEASSERQRWGQSPPAQRQLPTGSVTAVTLFRSNQRRQRMTWGWCSPAPGLIGPSSGLNAKVSWQREAEEPDFAVPAGLRERQASRARSSAQGPRPSSGTVSAVRACPALPGHREGSTRCGDTCPPAGTRRHRHRHGSAAGFGSE